MLQTIRARPACERGDQHKQRDQESPLSLHTFKTRGTGDCYWNWHGPHSVEKAETSSVQAARDWCKMRPNPSFAMLNLHQAVRANPSYSKLEIGEFLFAEYTCGVTAKKLPNWTETDYFVHEVTGKKTWHTGDGVMPTKPGDILFFK